MRPAGTRLQRRQRGLNGVNHPHEIDIHHPPKQRRVRFAERRRFRAACIGDQDIDRLTGGGFGNRGADGGP
jgi:hypothetical protein